MNVQRQQTFHPIIIKRPVSILVPHGSNNITTNKLPTHSSQVHLSQRSGQNVPPGQSIANETPLTIKIVSSVQKTSQPPSNLKTTEYGRILSLSQPVPKVVRRPLQDLSSSQNISSSRVLQHQPIPRQHPLDKDLLQAKSISESVKSICHTPALDQAEDELSEDDSMPRKEPGSTSKAPKIFKGKLSVCRQKKGEAKNLIPQAEKNLLQAITISESVKSVCHQTTPASLDEAEDDLSEDDFMPRKETGSTSKAPRRKKLSVCRLKEEEAKNLIAQAEEKSLSDTFSKVHDILPSCSSYVVTECTSLEDRTWTATIRANMNNRQEAETWLTEFERENSLDFRFRKSVDSENSGRLLFKRQYRCHHNTMPKANGKEGKKSKNFQSKNTNCPAYVRITIKHKDMKWSSDYLLQAYPCEIIIRHTHNHPILCANALRRRRPSQIILEKFTSLLQKGYSPLAALECHKCDLFTEYGDDYYKVSADQSLCPSNFWVYKLFKKLCIKNYGPQTGDDMIVALQKFCEDYNKECQSECAKCVTTEDGQLAVAICTPMMKRASTLLKTAGEILFADSSGTMDALNCKMFLLQTNSVAGGIPLGALIVTSERESVLDVALDLWKSLLPQNAFYGRGPNVGPKLIMTDDCTSERNSFKAAFMACILLLCLFHILQAFWRYVWNREQNVSKEDRGEIFFLFRDIVYAETEEIFIERLECARNSEKMKKYPKVLAHLETYIPRAKEWALCFRKNLLTRGNDTNNYSEAGIKAFKDKALERRKAFNPVHLAEFVVTRYEAYLQRRVIDVINNRASNPFKSRFYVRPEKIEGLDCKKLDSPPNVYLVKNISKGTEYVVVMDLEICSCPAGQSGAPCKHMSAVVQKFKLASSLVHPLLQCHNPSLKKILFEVVHGHQNVPNEWFADLQQENLEDACPSVAVNMDVAVDSLETECESGMDIGVESAGEKPHISDEDLKTLDDSLDAIFSKYKQGIREDPQYVDAIKVFVRQNEKFSHSESGLLSALHTFGKTSGPLPLGFERKRSGANIPVQPGSKARRTVYIGGSRAQFTGRPSNAMAAAPTLGDHSYNPPKKTSAPDTAWHKLPTKVYAAPHALLQCVTNNRMVGSNHSRK